MNALSAIFVAAIAATAVAQEPPRASAPPAVVKKGTIGVDLCETTPFVFKGKLYRLEWKRASPHDHSSYLRIMDHDSQTEVSRFGEHHRFPCAIVEGDTVYVIGTTEDQGWCGTTLTLFTSKDLKHWDEQVAYHNPKFRMCNTSACKAGDHFVMSVELAVGGYMGRFLESKDLIHWSLMPPECTIGGGSPHCLRYANGWYYLFSTVAGYRATRAGEYGGYVMVLNRSRDLKTWKPSPFNPVLVGSDDDKRILSPKLTAQDRADIAKNAIRNNSDIDFCEYQGKMIINYCWGTQGGPGHEYVAEAEYAGTETQFLEGWFPGPGSEGKKSGDASSPTR